MNETILRIRTIYNGEGVQKASSSIKGLKDTVKEASSTAHHAHTIFSNFASSLTRIAKLRLLRGIIRSITQAFKEGTENIYHYSQALGAADASHFANTMDSLASSMLYMKNSIGAIVAPLLTSLLPAIQTIVNWFVTATQVVAQFFAALGGQVMYTRAKEHATQWKNIGSAAGGAAAAAKEYQNTILSFDEIHALNDVPSPGGGGGGSGADVPDYSDMFEEALIDEKIKKLGEWLRKNFEGILDLVKAIAAVMIAWKIATNVVDFFKGLGLLDGYGATQFKTLSLGIILTVAGITLAAKGGYDIGYDGANLIDIIKTALGNAMAGVGGALISVALGGSAAAGFVVTFGVALLATVIGFQIGQDEAMLDNTYRLTESYHDYTVTMQVLTEVLSHYNTAQYTAEEIMAKFNDTASKVRLAEILIPQIEDLTNKTDRSEYETEKLYTLIDQLNELKLDGVVAEYDRSTETVTINTQAIKDNLDALLASAKKAAYLEVLKEAWKDEARAVLDHNIALGAAEDAEMHLADATERLRAYEEQFGGTLDYDIDVVKQMEEEIADWSDAQAEAKKAIQETNKRVQESTRYSQDAERAYRRVQEELDGVSSSASGAKKELFDFNKQLSTLNGLSINNFIQAGLDGIKNSAYWAYWELKGVNEQILELSRATLGGLSIGIYAALGKSEGGFVNGYANGGIIPRFDGGGINSAQLFLANENGMPPEMIGTIGNRTAVANQGQMVEAMAEGVYRAMSNVMSNGNSNTEVNVYMNDEVVARAADRGNRSLNRRFNVSLA